MFLRYFLTFPNLSCLDIFFIRGEIRENVLRTTTCRLSAIDRRCPPVKCLKK